MKINLHIYPAAIKGESMVHCPEANIDQTFLNEDIPELLRDLPHLIEAEEKYNKTRNPQQDDSTK